MNYLKSYKLFLEADEFDTDNINSVEPDTQSDIESKKTRLEALDGILKNLKEFQVKRQSMENIFNDPNITKNVDLEKKLLTTVYNNNKEAKKQNKYLKDFESILRQDRRRKKLQTSINADQDQIKEVDVDLKELTNDSREDLNPETISRIDKSIERKRKRLSRLKDNLQKNKTLLARDIINWQKKREDYKRDMKDEEERIKKLISKI